MSRAGVLVAAAFALVAASGCAQITGTQNATQAVSGELWYVKQRALFGLIFSSKIYHCAPPSSGPAKCKEATIAAGASLSDMADSAASATTESATKAGDDASAEANKDTKDKDAAKDKDATKDKDASKDKDAAKDKDASKDKSKDKDATKDKKKK